MPTRDDDDTPRQASKPTEDRVQISDDVAVPSQFAFIASQISSPSALLAVVSVPYDEGREEGVFGGQMQFAFSPLLFIVIVALDV